MMTERSENRDHEDEYDECADGDDLDPWGSVTDRVGADVRAGDGECECAECTGRDRRAGDDPLGSIAEEARRFVGALQDRAGRELGKIMIRGAAGGIGQVLGEGNRRDVWEEAVSAPEDEEYVCRACPICRLIAAQRESGASVADHLAAAGGELLTAIRQAVDALSRPSASRGPRQDSPDVEHGDPG